MLQSRPGLFDISDWWEYRFLICFASFNTLQPINSPLLKLLEGDLRRGRRVVQVQAMRIVLLLVDRRSKLSFLVVDSRPAFRVDPMCILSNHFVSYMKLGRCFARLRFGAMHRISPLSLGTELMNATRAHATGQGHVHLERQIILALEFRP